ncbi:MAG: Prolipoprotein diacylglyceryl transferase [bacterium ADurb.Bin236]|nr:MAG: Prolipoprotein diacylglyceryl transferase [bacterium ADurb.Bin236]HOY62713.1 prolipoprotein diacylglyceryl transferase [bacterium]HPN93317.1 prolipoprotein diacylglyceryl transferase [bacterium]
MHPIFFSFPQMEILGRTFGPLHIHAYGVMLAVAFLFGLALLVREGRRYKFSSDDMLDMTIYIIISSIIGARIMYILLSIGDYSTDPLGALKIYEGGLSQHGGVIGGFAGLALFGWRKKYSIAALCDAAAPPLVLGSAIARWGCFLNGCCYGAPWNGPFAVVFPSLGDGLPRHPAMLYDSFLHFALLGAMFALRRFKRKDGDMVAFYLIGFAILRFITEIFRSGNTGVAVVGTITIAQLVSIPLIAAGIFIYTRPAKPVAAPPAKNIKKNSNPPKKTKGSSASAPQKKKNKGKR